jgi:hypothetical protein
VDGADTPAATESLTVKGGEPAVFALETETREFARLRVVIAEADAFSLDNEFILHNIESENSYDTLLVSERPTFLKAALSSRLGASIDVIKPEEYEAQRGYGLYVFDTVVPMGMELPTDGTVWMVNVDGSIEGAGYTVQGAVTLNKAEPLTLSTSTATATKTLIEGLSGRDITVTRYIKCGFYRNFTTLFSYKGSPVIFAGVTEYGNREAVIAFDLHDSDLPLLADYSVLIGNLLEFSFPDMIESTAYTCGETVTVNVIPNTESIRVDSPSGDVRYLKTDGASDSFRLTEAGIYRVSITVAGSVREFSIWSSMDPAECDPALTIDRVSLQGEATDGGFDGSFDPIWVIFIALAVVFLADWMVYCYEKYQLR